MATPLFLLFVHFMNDLDAALKAAADRNPDHRIRSLDDLRNSKDRRARETLLRLMGDEHPRVRLRTLHALRDSADRLEILKAALRHSSPRIRQSGCEALGDLPAGDSVPLLLDRLGDGDPRVQAQAADSLGRLADPAVCPRLIDAFKRDTDWAFRASALEAVHRLSPDRDAEILETALRDPNYQVRLAAAATGRPEALAALVSDRDWRVRAAAIDACRSRRDSIGRLVEQLPRETGRLRWDIVAALQALTGKSLGLDPGAWKRWWEAGRESAATPPSPGETQASFFKVPILSTRLVFLLDLSGSMRDPSPEGGSKLDVARQGMIETIRSLPATARFGILGLGCDAEGAYLEREKKTWQGRPALVAAGAAAKADAERFVRGLEAKGWTNLYDGIEYAFSDADVDTIYLYTDGGASKGTFVASAEILSALAAMNRYRRIVVHTVEVPGAKNAPAHRRLLQAIAESTGGTCTLYEGRFHDERR